ncbi:hypothetical protein OIE66_05210 [Nonomuraea sp. NBC_01738]|uniref:hypothetical protein n=1 Tax=Nonomuraea sp. NBC_01738 TaxID=2976003 RepID=UPI002E146D48|nr:hypothetical protein OIE66_05210 [Nonomuraea sp. NBC_01738]
MSYDILGLTPNAPLVLTPGTTVYSGVVRIGQNARVQVFRSDEPARDFGFYPPDVPPLEDAAPAPRVWVEAQVMWFVPGTQSSGRFPVGVERISAAYTPDPRGSGARWLLVTGAAHAASGLQLAYRVTLQRA